MWHWISTFAGMTEPSFIIKKSIAVIADTLSYLRRQVSRKKAL